MHDIARAASDAAEIPDFALVARRGRGRRIRRQTGVLGAVAVSVAVVAGLTQVAGGGGDAPRPAPAPIEQTTSTVTPPPADPGGRLAGIVDAPDAQVTDVAVMPGAAEVMATIWQKRGKSVLALTSDGFTSRILIQVPEMSNVEAGPRGKFVVARGWDGQDVRLVGPDGSSSRVRVEGRESPLSADDVAVVVGLPGQTVGVLAVRPDGTAVPVPVPDRIIDMRYFGGRLVGIGFGDTATYHWSDDGGATWGSHDLGIDSVFASPVVSAAGQDHAVVEGGDGATLFPLVALHTASASDPAAWTRTTARREETHWTFDGAWVEDDDGVRLLLTGEPIGRGAGQSESGVYRVVDRAPVEVEGLDGLRRGAGLWLLQAEYRDGPVVWIAGDQHEIWRTVDGGATWEPFRAR